jgi:opacity protein-like surface antigen
MNQNEMMQINMKNRILLLFFSLIFAMAADARDREDSQDSCCVDMTNIYAKIFGGVNFLQNTTISGNKTEYHAGYIFAGSLGYCWRYGLHVEGEYAFRRNAINKIHFSSQGVSKDGHFQTSSYMANLLWYLPLCSWGYTFWHIRPLFGAGIGYDSQKMHASNSRIDFNEKWHHFSWQLMAGLAFPISCHTELTLEYKFHQGGSHFYNNAVGLGLTYKFGLR